MPRPNRVRKPPGPHRRNILTALARGSKKPRRSEAKHYCEKAPRHHPEHEKAPPAGGDYAADRAFRQYAADPANRLVAGELETRWNKALARVAEVEGKIAAHDTATVAPVADPASLGTLAADLRIVWTAPTTDARLKKRIVRTVIHEVIADIDADAAERKF